VPELKRENIAVIGCGVIGLTSAIRLQQRGFNVTIIARDLPPHTTSDVAAAFWFPYKAMPKNRVLPWAATTRLEYEKNGNAEFGISLTPAMSLYRVPTPEPWWTACITSRRLSASELPAGYVDGFLQTVPLVETSRYIPHLLTRFRSAGGKIEQRTLQSLSEVPQEFKLIVNCSGVWAGKLVNDERVFPIRGQIVRVQKSSSGMNSTIIFDEAVPTYIVPRSGDCIFGGTADAGNWSLEPGTEIARDILQRCKPLTQFEPAILEHKVGLRPGRDEVRLELENFSGRPVIHNYGHGGAGFTLCWGCADEVAGIANNEISRRDKN
jgi:D-amino-acid oxidase